MKKAIIFDIDGTLSDPKHRLHHIKNGARNWDAFFAETMGDDPVEEIIAVNHAFEDQGKLFAAYSKKLPYALIIVTARNRDNEDMTRAWLKEHKIAFDKIYMRASKDYREDSIVKQEILEQIREDGYEPFLVFDDRQRVVDMWRDNGIKVAHVSHDWDAVEKSFVQVGDNLLYLMVGPSGGGKSTLLTDHFSTHEVLSSDQVRGRMLGDWKDQSENDRVFSYIHAAGKARVNHRLTTVIDATHLRKRDRMASVRIAPPNTIVTYIVVDRPLIDKIGDGGWRNDVYIKGKTLIEAHHERFKSVRDDVLNGDGLDNVIVWDYTNGYKPRMTHRLPRLATAAELDAKGQDTEWVGPSKKGLAKYKESV